MLSHVAAALEAMKTVITLYIPLIEVLRGGSSIWKRNDLNLQLTLQPEAFLFFVKVGKKVHYCCDYY